MGSIFFVPTLVLYFNDKWMSDLRNKDITTMHKFLLFFCKMKALYLENHKDIVENIVRLFLLRSPISLVEFEFPVRIVAPDRFLSSRSKSLFSKRPNQSLHVVSDRGWSS